MTETVQEDRAAGRHWLGLVAGGALFVGLLSAQTPDGMPAAAQRLAAVTALMAVLWMTQAIPIAATSLIPLAAFPLLGIQSAKVVSKSYIDQNIFLFLGGFIIALGIEKWGLHRRIALHIVRLLGSGPKRIVLGFMLATAFLSMWISNTASTLLMLPIGLALLTSLRDLSPTGGDVGEKSASDAAYDRLSVVVLLGIAYSASLGGLTTLVGTPTNVAFQRIWTERFPDAPALSAGEWMVAVVPFGAVFLLCAWGVLTFRLPVLPGAERFQRGFFTERLRALGKPSRAEWLMLVVFVTTAALWIFRKPLSWQGQIVVSGWSEIVVGWLSEWGVSSENPADWVHDSTVAVAMALLMFFIPAGRDGKQRVRYLMDWETAERLPWGILLLIGGGFALADGFSVSGLSQWIGDSFAGAVAGWPIWLLVGCVCLLMTFLTELTSNVATVSTILPILAGTALSIGVDPRLLMFPATISASCAFMLPIATPPNAIVFGSGRIRMGQMMRYGILLNILGVILMTLATYLLLVPQLGISLDGVPEWGK